MKKIISLALVFVMVMCLFVACADKGIVGKWEFSMLGATMTLDFSDDGYLTFDVMGEKDTVMYKYEDGKLSLSEDGSYWVEDAIEVKSLKGNELVIDFDGVDLTFKRK